MPTVGKEITYSKKKNWIMKWTKLNWSGWVRGKEKGRRLFWRTRNFKLFCSEERKNELMIWGLKWGEGERGKNKVIIARPKENRKHNCMFPFFYYCLPFSLFLLSIFLVCLFCIFLLYWKILINIYIFKKRERKNGDSEVIIRLIAVIGIRYMCQPISDNSGSYMFFLKKIKNKKKVKW